MVRGSSETLRCADERWGCLGTRQATELKGYIGHLASCGMRCGLFKADPERNLQAAMWPWMCLGRAMYLCLLTPSHAWECHLRHESLDELAGSL